MGKGLKRMFSMTESVAPAAKRFRAGMKIKKFMMRGRKGGKYGSPSANVPEYKFIDVNVNVNSSNAGAAQLLTVVAEGSDNTDRIGRKITMKSFDYDLTWSNGLADLATLASWPEGAAKLKIGFVWDKQPNGALATYANVYSTAGTVLAPFRHRNPNNIDRFDVLAVEDVVISAGGPNTVQMKRHVKTNLVTRFDGTTSAIGDISSGALIIVFADNNTDNAALCLLLGEVRILFSDD